MGLTCLPTLTTLHRIKNSRREIGTGVPVAAEVSAGAPLAESVIDVSGEWSIDEKRNTSRFIKSGSMKITRNGAVFSVHGMTAWSWFCFWGKKDWFAVLIAVKDAPNTYDVRVEGNTMRVTVLSEDEIKAEGDKLKEPLLLHTVNYSLQAGGIKPCIYHILLSAYVNIYLREHCTS